MHLRLGGATLAAAAVATTAISTSAAQAAHLPELPTYSGADVPHSPAVRPHSIIWTEDGSGALAGSGPTVSHAGNLRWRSYQHGAASATGKDWRDNCKPNCAEGHFTGYPVTIYAFRPRRLGRHLVFTRLTVHYTRGKPSFALTYLYLTFGSSAGYVWRLPVRHA